MPLPKAWGLKPHRVLSDSEAKELLNQVKSVVDLKENCLDEIVEKNIEKNRKTNTRLEIYKANNLFDPNGVELADAEVTVKQISHEFNFGCNAFLAGQFDSDEKNAEYEHIFSTVFNQAVLPFYWKDEEPVKGQPRFDKNSSFCYRRPPADYMLEFCEKTNCRPKGHNLMWRSNLGLPTWLGNNKFQNGVEIEKRIRNLAERYADKIPMWDVTNEFTGSNYRADVLPEDTDIRVWKLANELFHNNHLITNDFQCLFNDHYKETMSAFYTQVQRLEENGIRVDGIGMQCHMFHNENELMTDEPQKLTAEYMMKMINTYSALGKDIHLSEITLPSYDGRETYLEMQNILTENLYKLWFSMEKVKSIVWWNLVDNTAVKVSPNAPFDENYFGGGLLLNDFTKKPSFETVERLINHEWHTEEKLVTNKNGYAQFSGFNGDYEVTIKKGVTEEKKIITVTKDKPLVTILV